MSKTQTRVVWSAILLFAAAVCFGFTYPFASNQDEGAKSVPVEKLLPADAVVYIGADGHDAHRAEFEKTAAYEAIYKSGLADVFKKLVDYGFMKAGQGKGYELFKKTYTKISGKGLSVAVSVSADVGPPQPWAIIVLHEAADLEGDLSAVIKKASKDELKWETKTISGREVTRADIPASGAPFKLEIGWWKDGNHLVIAGGANAIDSAISVATGAKPNITTNRLWKKYRGEKTKFTVAGVGWFDIATLRKMFGALPIPNTGTREKPGTVNDVLAALGLSNADAIVGRSGFSGRESWSEVVLEAPGDKKGLLSLLAPKPMTINDLPPLPAQTSNFYACSVDFSKDYNAVTDVIRKAAKLGPPEASAGVEVFFDQLPGIVGFDPDKDLFGTFGDVLCLYDDPGQGPFGIGAGMAIKLKDGKRLERTLNDIFIRIGDTAPPGQFKVHRVKKHGTEIVTLEIAKGVVTISYAITKDWFSMAAYPQSVEAFLLRLDKRLPTWTPTPEYQEGLDRLPKRFAAISVTDPRATYRFLIGLAPPLFSFAKIGLSQTGMNFDDFPVKLTDLPPAELVTQPLFPNISVRTVDRDAIRWTSRSSLPGLFGADTVVVSAAAVALLLPAVQQARQAARRSQSKNNLKQIGLALHNYHDTHGSFPQGTVPNAKLKPDQRLSWQASILPYIEQAALYDRIDRKKGWKDDANARWTGTAISAFQNPGVVKFKPEQTHYVGMAGVGENSLTTTKLDNKVGIFGYNRQTSLRDITDGTSNTIMVLEASKDFGSWAAGGKSTIRAFTKKPYVNGPDGIGGPWNGGFHVLMGDGSVKFISERIDPSVLEKLATMRGGEALGEF